MNVSNETLLCDWHPEADLPDLVVLVSPAETKDVVIKGDRLVAFTTADGARFSQPTASKQPLFRVVGASGKASFVQP